MNRLERVFRQAGVKENEAIYVTKPSNIYYLSGYTGEGVLVAGQGFQAIVTDFRYTEQAEHQAPGFEVHMIEKGLSHAALSGKLFSAHKIETVYYEDDAVTVRAFEGVKKAMPGLSFLSLQNAPESCRNIKDAGELAFIEEACTISCKAFEHFLPRLRPGMTEKQAQILLDNTMLEMGADGTAFATIVASGENGSLPHAIPGEREIQMGDMITFDFGAKKHGYCADMTRTVALGKPNDEMLRIYNTVLLAQETAEAALAPGKQCNEIDALARKIIDDAGYPGRFGHGLGHGVGIDIHEDPRLSQVCDTVLVPGHVVTVEPGIYVPGLGGVRIENTCAVTEKGARTLVYAQKALLIL